MNADSRMRPGRPLSVAFTMHDLSGGGVERMRLLLIEALRQRGVDVTLVVNTEDGPLRAALPRNLKLVVLGRARTIAGILPLARFLRRARPDILVSSLDHNNIAALAAHLLGGRRTRLVICQHNALSAEAALGWKYRLVPFAYRLLHRAASGIVAVSDGVAADLAATSGIARARITTIRNPVIGPDFAARAAQPAPHPWFADASRPVFVSAGRLCAQKDPQTLLCAFARLHHHMPACLIFLGDGDMRAELETTSRLLGLDDCVLFAGFRRDPLPWIAYAAALVLSSRYEGFGNVLAEALACGTPVVSTDCPWGPAEILENGRFGLLAPVGDTQALARAMQQSLETPWDREQLRRRGLTYSADACAERHLALFASILPGEGPGRRRPSRPVLGLTLSTMDASETVAALFAATPKGGAELVVTPNLDHLRHLRRPEFAKAYRAATLCCPDGFPVVLYGKLRGLPLRGRVTGCEIFHRIATHPDLSRQRLFVIAESRQTERAIAAWASRLGLGDSIGAIAAPKFLATDDRAARWVADAVRAFAPTLLIVTLGAPVSELFVHRNREALGPCWALCLGQAVRVELGLIRRAPPLWQRCGLEAAWRIAQEPRRLTGRYLKALAWFPVAVARDLRSQGTSAIS